MAGLGEACSHIAALLFWLEANNRLLADPSCTSVPCQWSAPTMQNVDYRQIKDIDFASPEFKMNHGAKKKRAAHKRLPFQNQLLKSWTTSMIF